MPFSVLMSIYAKEKPQYLLECLKSIQNQTLQPDEIVLVKDGELTIELNQVLDEAKQKMHNLKIYETHKNIQLGRALNQGLTICKNELVARMDTDDIAVKNRFEVQYGYMLQNPNVDVVGGFIEEFNENIDKTYIKKMPETMSDIMQYAKYRNPVNHMTVMFRKSAVLNAGNYQHFPYLEDYNLWVRMLAKKAEFFNLQQVLVRARVSDEFYKRRGGKEYFAQYMILRKLQKDLDLVNSLEFIKGVFLSFSVTLQPSWVRKLIYQKLIRKR